MPKFMDRIGKTFAEISRAQFQCYMNVN